MDLEFLTKTRASTVIESDDSEISFLNIDVGEDLKNLFISDQNPYIEFYNKKITNCHFTIDTEVLKGHRSGRTQIVFTDGSISDVTIEIPVRVRRIVLRDVVVDTLNIVFTDEGYVQEVLLCGVKAKTINIIEKDFSDSFKESLNKSLINIAFENTCIIDNLNYLGTEKDLTNQFVTLIYPSLLGSEITINNLKMQNVILKKNDRVCYYDGETDLSIFIYNLELDNVTTRDYLNTTVFNLKLNLFNTNNFKKHLEGSSGTDVYNSTIEFLETLGETFTPSSYLQAITFSEVSSIDGTRIFGVVKNGNCRWSKITFKTKLSEALGQLDIVKSITNYILSSIRQARNDTNIIVTPEIINSLNECILDLCTIPGKILDPLDPRIPVIKLNNSGDIEIILHADKIHDHLRNYSYSNLSELKERYATTERLKLKTQESPEQVRFNLGDIPDFMPRPEFRDFITTQPIINATMEGVTRFRQSEVRSEHSRSNELFRAVSETLNSEIDYATLYSYHNLNIQPADARMIWLDTEGFSSTIHPEIDIFGDSD